MAINLAISVLLAICVVLFNVYAAVLSTIFYAILSTLFSLIFSLLFSLCCFVSYFLKASARA